MAHPNSLKNLKPFPAGVSGNQGRGRNNLPEDLKGIKSLSQAEVVKLISKYARMSFEELNAIAKNKAAPVVEIHIASIFLAGITNGDFTRLSFLLDRCVGKAPIIIEEDDSDRAELKKLTLNELLTFVRTNLPPEAI